MNKESPFKINYLSDSKAGRLNSSVTVDVKEGIDAPTFDIRLPEPIWLSGRAIDADTGKGVVGATVFYSRTVEPNAAEASASSTAVSNSMGEFRILVAHGHGTLHIDGSLNGYFTSRTLTKEADGYKSEYIPPPLAILVPDDGKVAPVTLPVTRGTIVRGIVRGADGKPQANALVEGFGSAITDFQGRFQIDGHSPRAGGTLTIAGRSGVGQATVDAAPDHPLDKSRTVDVEIPLKPGVALMGRVVHEGRPREGVVVQLFRGVESKSKGPSGAKVLSRRFFRDSVTDAEGRYRIDGLEAGDRYVVEIAYAAGMLPIDYWTWALKASDSVIPEGRAEIELPDVKLTAHRQALRGVVVNQDGKPMPGVGLQAMLPKVVEKKVKLPAAAKNKVPQPKESEPYWSTKGPGFGISRNPQLSVPPSTETDKDGRFEFRQLPDLPMEITLKGLYLNRFSIAVRPELNQQDIRIVLDFNAPKAVPKPGAPVR